MTLKPVVSALLELIGLERLEVNLFRGRSVATGQRSVFGGLVAGQALMAASYTVPEDRTVHSLHAYFLRPGDFNAPIIYDVDPIRDGRSFTTRRVNAIQHGRPILSLAASFQVDEPGVTHQAVMPEVPPPETVATDHAVREQFAAKIPEQFRKAFMQERPIELRPIKPENPFVAEPQSALRHAWFRIPGPLDADPAMHRALLTFCSDIGLLGTSMLPHGIHFFQPGVQSASIDHAMWFHREFRIDEWLLYTTDSPSASGARGMNRGSIFRQDGTLVASVAQEGLMRVHGT